jgi:sporadic carbohydrate cluster 2OG-Fe(II) oxygenase
MNNYFSSDETKIIEEFNSKGYVIRPVREIEELNELRGEVCNFLREISGLVIDENEELLNHFHNHFSASQLNNLRVQLIEKINSTNWFRQAYYRLSKHLLDAIVGNELVMQRRINLSIQMPFDSSSLLPIHADTWSGDSPFEAVIWIPLVSCEKTKSMYILPSNIVGAPIDFLKMSTAVDSEGLYSEYQDDVEFLKISFGEVLIFNQALPHGNRINLESTTRFSMNCRFKGVFTPYHDKALGEFFEPITLRPMSRLGLFYGDIEVKE